jgi:hypothetical protein
MRHGGAGWSFVARAALAWSLVAFLLAQRIEARLRAPAPSRVVASAS